MIRFCDREVNCVIEEGLTRGELFSYFFNNSRDDLLCVIDEKGRFIGCITYTSLLNSNNVKDSIWTEKLVLNEFIWENGRKLFCSYKKQSNEVVLIPVVNGDGQLLCFAYQDEDANREIRQLRELTICSGVLGFHDIYPEYDCVTIWECNELAFYFAEYLQKMGVPFNVKGSLWEEFGKWEKYESLDYRNMDIYAEGTWDKCTNMREYLLRSVSVEFECIDKIYEENILKGRIVDADKTLEEFILGLKKETNLFLLGTNIESQDTYDFLLEHEIDIMGFISDEQEDNQRQVVGKPVYSWYEMPDADHAVLIECTQKHSAWGFGAVDFYDYAGYHRNDRYFLVKDYYEREERSLLKHVLRGKRIVLAGDLLLCRKIYMYLKQIAVCHYWDIMDAGNFMEECQTIQGEEIVRDDICLLVVPEYFVSGNYSRDVEKKRMDCIARMREYGIVNYTDYFCETGNLLELEKSDKYKEWVNYPKGICIGAIQYCCGNIFFRSILEGHPQILMMDSCYLSDNLFFICLRLSVEKSENIACCFWKMIENELHMVSLELENMFPNRERFNQMLKYELEKKAGFTSQELFVILHLAYAAMWNDISDDISNMVIYWEPHFIQRHICEMYSKWLNMERVSGYIVNVVRNGCIRAGSYLKFWEQSGKLESLRMGHYWNMVDELEPQRKLYDGYIRIVLKFEDLKCKSEEMLEELCHNLKVEWSDILLQTTSHGEIAEWRGTSGFDLRPVYDTYEKYFSEYDRMRLMLLLHEWQIEYGYPCVDVWLFSRKELQEMLMKDFRFEGVYEYWDETGLWVYKMQKMDWMRRHMQQLICEQKFKNKLSTDI